MNTSLTPTPAERRARYLRPAMLGLVLMLALNTAAGAATLSVLHDFDGIDGLGAYSTGQLAQGRDGNLYGTIPYGGAIGVGTAFKVTPGGTFTKLHDFDNDSDGNLPFGGLTLGKDGNFYGTTAFRDYWARSGTVFKLTPAGVLTTLHAFDPAAGEGAVPMAPPVQGRDGNFYGTTSEGGAMGAGTVYKLTPSGGFTTLFSFPYDPVLGIFPRGAGPQAPLILGADGALYGTAINGGNGHGTVFKITTAGAASTIYSFDYTHGCAPNGPVAQGTDGNLYGTTVACGAMGGGVVFKLSLKGVITVLHDFDATNEGGAAQGYEPFAGLVQGSDGNFYGVTSVGGLYPYGSVSPSAGVLFKITPAGDYTVQASFDGANGANPYATPFLHTNGRVYGLTQAGGGGASAGTLYSLDVGAPGFVSAIPNAATAGTSIGLLGALAGTTGVSFNGVSASFAGGGNTYRTAVVPAGAATGLIKVTTPGGTPQTLKAFQQLPTLTAFSPASGAVGSSVILNGTGLSQATTVKFGGGKVASFVVNSATQVTATVPAGALTAKIAVTTKGGTVSTKTVFTVTP